MFCSYMLSERWSYSTIYTLNTTLADTIKFWMWWINVTYRALDTWGTNNSIIVWIINTTSNTYFWWRRSYRLLYYYGNWFGISFNLQFLIDTRSTIWILFDRRLFTDDIRSFNNFLWRCLYLPWRWWWFWKFNWLLISFYWIVRQDILSSNIIMMIMICIDCLPKFTMGKEWIFTWLK